MTRKYIVMVSVLLVTMLSYGCATSSPRSNNGDVPVAKWFYVNVPTSVDQAKEMADNLLSNNGNDHDDPGHLAWWGDCCAVPSMIAVLKRTAPEFEGQGVLCTYLHCLDALKEIVGQDLGKYVEPWEEWWLVYTTNNGPCSWGASTK